jgi:hypothetical protein
MPSRRTLATVGARVAVGIIGLAVAGATLAAAAFVPLPGHTTTVPSSTVTPVPADQQLVCPGPLLDLAADSSDATGLTAFGTPSVVAGASDGANPSISSLKAPDDSTAKFGGPQLVRIPAPAGASSAPLASAAQLQLAQTEDISGLATATCGAATADEWLVGGSSDLGQTTLVLLSNPTKVQASVDLAVYSESGQVAAPGAKGILVDPGSQKVVPLAGIAPDAKAPIVHVQASGGQVFASLQQSLVRGVQPGGVEMIGATAAPGTKAVIPGVVVATQPGAGGTDAGAADTPALRLLTTGSSPATVSIGIVAEQGTQGGSTASATLQPGIVQEVPLNRVVDGTFTITVTSSQPVVVAARTLTADGSDFAWFGAGTALNSSSMVSVPQGPGASLHLSNPTSSPAVVTVTAPDGSAQKVTVPASGGAPAAVSNPGGYTITGSKGLYASLSYSGASQLSSSLVYPPGPQQSPITVYPQ